MQLKSEQQYYFGPCNWVQTLKRSIQISIVLFSYQYSTITANFSKHTNRELLSETKNIPTNQSMFRRLDFNNDIYIRIKKFHINQPWSFLIKVHQDKIKNISLKSLSGIKYTSGMLKMIALFHPHFWILNFLLT